MSAFDPSFDLVERFIAALRAAGDQVMTLADDTKAALAKLQADVTGAITAGQAASSALRTEIATLKAQIAAGGALSTAELQTLHDNLVAVDTQVTTAVTNIGPTP